MDSQNAWELIMGHQNVEEFIQVQGAVKTTLIWRYIPDIKLDYFY
jgi:hypothetical protein